MPAADDERLHDVLRDDVRSITRGTADDAGGPARLPTDEALRAVAPRPVPSVVLSIAAKTPQEVARMLSAIPQRLDDTVARYPVKIELRLDPIAGFSERMTAASLVFKLGVPLIITLRARREGGASTATEPERQRFLLSMVGALRQAPPPGSLLDVEAAAVAADPEGWGQVFDQAHEKGFHVMLSHHDLEVSPERARALLPPDGLLDGTPGGGALLWKSATTVRTWSQDLAILRALSRGNQGPRRAAVMGMQSPTSRLLAPYFGAPIVYASVDEEHAAAPGQVPFDDLVHLWKRWGIEVEDPALLSSADGPAPRWALIGRPAYHSLSPAMHNDAARQAGRPERYLPIEVPEHTGTGTAQEAFEATIDTLRQVGVRGGNVTIPFKVPLAIAADRLEGDAAVLGAANTFVVEEDQIVAYNTDVAGVRSVLEAAGRAPAGKKVLVLGAGGAAAAASLACRDAEQVLVANRTEAHAATIAESIDGPIETVAWARRETAAADVDIIVQCTPLGMTGGPAPDQSPLPASAMRSGQVAFETVYVPQETPFLQAAQEAGATGIEGLQLLAAQGAASYRIWTGADVAVDALLRSARAAARVPMPAAIREAVRRQEVEA